MAEAETATRVEVGALIANTYEIKRLLGRGGMGTVWEAHHARLPGKRVAIKVLHPEVARDQESLARFRREAEIATRIGHPNIVEVHDFNQLPDGTPYLILEYLVGADLEDRLRKGPMSVDAVVALTRQIGSALRAAHDESVIHRDLKPQNVFLARTTDGAGNETEMAKVLDFGISKIRGSSTVQTQDSTILGTPQYMAPEQATGAHNSVDARTDVFALGAMVYEMLAGRPAFEGQTIPEVVFKVVYEDPRPLGELVSVPPNISHAVHTALSKKQDDRFSTVEEFITALSGTGLSVGPVHGHAPVRPPADHDVGTAATVASGTHTPVPGLANDIGTAKTIDSGRMQQDVLGLATSQTQLADSGALEPAVVPAQTAAVRPASKRGLKVAIALFVLLIAAGGAVAAYVISQQGDDEVAAKSEIDAAVSQPVATADAGPATPIPASADAAPESAVVDAAPATPAADARKVDKPNPKPPDRPPDNGKPNTGGTDTPPDNAGPDDPRTDLAQARKLISSNPREAIRLVRRAMRNGGGGERFQEVLALANCKLLDLTPVRAALRKIRSNGRRKRVIRRCRAFGMELE